MQIPRVSASLRQGMTIDNSMSPAAMPAAFGICIFRPESVRLNYNRVKDFAAPAQPVPFTWRRSLILSLAVAAGWLAVRLALLAAYGAPDPAINDEFAYLLGADTFAHGRLTNPPHPMPAFFASPGILVEPTYSPKYPPGQALMLAAGQALFGHPFYGVVLEGGFDRFFSCA